MAEDNELPGTPFLDDEGNELWVEGPDGTPVKVVMAPGCFDSFEGSQEELAELMEHIREMFMSGEAFEQADAMSLEDLEEELNEEEFGSLVTALGMIDNTRKLH